MFVSLLLKERSALAVLTAVLICSAFTSTSSAQSGGPGDQPIDDRLKLEIIDSVSNALNTTYIFPDAASKIEKHIRDRFKKKSYAEFARMDGFLQALTDDIRSINNDRHLWVEYLPDERIALLDSDTNGAAAAAEDLRQSRQRNFGFRELRILPGNVGYLKLNSFSDFNEAGVVAIGAMNYLSNANAIIFDLRDNGGGSTKMIQLLTSYFFDEPTHLNSFYIRRTDTIEQFWTQGHVSGPRLTATDVYILTSEFTFSAAEEFSYNFKNLKRGTIVGDTSGGGAHPNEFVHWRNLHVTMSIPFGKAINPITGTNWEGTGVIPDMPCPTNMALDVAHQDALKKILARTTDERARFELEWAIAGLEDKINPRQVDVSRLANYAGTYGPREIKFEDGRLFYRRGENPWAPLVPMTDTLFRLEGVDYFRLEIVSGADGKPTELVGHYDNGTVDRSERTIP